MDAFSGREDRCVADAFELIDDLRGLTADSAISQRLRDALAGLGFHAFLMTRLPSRKERIDPYIVLMSWPRDWLLRYGHQGYYADDPVAQTCFTTLRPFVWSDGRSDQCDPDRARRVMDEATEFGLNEGVIVPMHDLSGRQASFRWGRERWICPPPA